MQFRALMLSAMEKLGPHNPIMFSGGVDSATMLAAALELGAKPDLFTFRVGDEDSEDVQYCRMMAREFDLKLYVDSMPTDLDTLVSDLRDLMPIILTTQKTHIQCTHPLMYMLPRAKAMGYDKMWAGMCAGPLWGHTRRAEQLLHEKGPEAHKEFRRNKWKDLNIVDRSVDIYAEHLGMEIIDPYKYRPLAEFALELDHATVHKPFQKALVVNAFPEFWKDRGWYRKNSNMQINSGLREWHHDVLVNSDYNVNGWRSVLGIYNHLYKGLGLTEKIHLEGERLGYV